MVTIQLGTGTSALRWLLYLKFQMNGSLGKGLCVFSATSTSNGPHFQPTIKYINRPIPLLLLNTQGSYNHGNIILRGECTETGCFVPYLYSVCTNTDTQLLFCKLLRCCVTLLATTKHLCGTIHDYVCFKTDPHQQGSSTAPIHPYIHT